MVHMQRQSILPPPEELEKYELYAPGITKELLAQFKKQSDHRMSLETKVIDSGIVNSRIGQIFAFVIGMTALIFGFVLLLKDKQVSGIATIVCALATLLGVFIYGNESKKKERVEKSQMTPE